MADKTNGTCNIHDDGCTKFQLLGMRVEVVEKIVRTVKYQFWTIIVLLLAVLIKSVILG